MRTATGRGWTPRLVMRRVRVPRSTPEQLWTALVALVLALVVAGIAVALSIRSADDRTHDIDVRLGPVGSGSLTAYRALAESDAALVGQVLGTPIGVVPDRDVFDDRITEAAGNVALTSASTGDDAAAAERLSDVAAALPTYSVLAERARAAGPSLAADPDALRHATDLMQSTILPTAEGVQSRQAAQLDDAYSRADEVPVVAIVLSVAVLAGLVVVSVLLWRRTRRVFSIGMVIATLAVLAGAGWWAFTGVVGAGHLEASRAHLELVTDALGPAQVAAAQARSAEGLALVGPTPGVDDAFRDQMIVLARDDGAGGALGAARALAAFDPVATANVNAAVSAVREYERAHAGVRALLAAGRVDEATRSVVVPTADSSASAYAQLDTVLAGAVDRETESFRTEIARAEAWRGGVAVTVLLFGILAAVGVCWGLGRRIVEYR